MLFPVFWRPVGFSTYIFGGDPLFPPTRARAFHARVRVGGNLARGLRPKNGGETQRAQTDQPDPQLIKHNRDEKKNLMKSFCV